MMAMLRICKGLRPEPASPVLDVRRAVYGEALESTSGEITDGKGGIGGRGGKEAHRRCRPCRLYRPIRTSDLSPSARSHARSAYRASPPAPPRARAGCRRDL